MAATTPKRKKVFDERRVRSASASTKRLNSFYRRQSDFVKQKEISKQEILNTEQRKCNFMPKICARSRQLAPISSLSAKRLSQQYTSRKSHQECVKSVEKPKRHNFSKEKSPIKRPQMLYKKDRKDDKKDNTTVALWQKLYSDYWKIKEKRDQQQKKHSQEREKLERESCTFQPEIKSDIIRNKGGLANRCREW